MGCSASIRPSAGFHERIFNRGRNLNGPSVNARNSAASVNFVVIWLMRESSWTQDLYLLKGFKVYSTRWEKWGDEADLYERFHESAREALKLKIAEYSFSISTELAMRAFTRGSLGSYWRPHFTHFSLCKIQRNEAATLGLPINFIWLLLRWVYSKNSGGNSETTSNTFLQYAPSYTSSFTGYSGHSS